MVTDNTPQLSGLFGVYLQVGDLDRSLSFYRDVLALEVVWNDGALAVLHSHRAPADSLVIRAIGKAARHNMGEAGVTRVHARHPDACQPGHRAAASPAHPGGEYSPTAPADTGQHPEHQPPADSGTHNGG